MNGEIPDIRDKLINLGFIIDKEYKEDSSYTFIFCYSNDEYSIEIGDDKTYVERIRGENDTTRYNIDNDEILEEIDNIYQEIHNK